MKKIAALILALMFVFAFTACKQEPSAPADDATTAPIAAPAEDGTTTVPTVEPAGNTVIRLSTTTSVNDSGLLPYLLPTFEAETGYKVEVQSAGTGAAIQKAMDGNADVILVHAKASEEKFIEDGYGVERLPFMFNYFVIVGPKDDPAGVAGSENAAEAFAKIRETESRFVSRGDQSGTHKAELKIWGDDAPDAAEDSWYISAGQGMGACLVMASEQQAYCLTDKATFLSNQADLDLDIVLAEGEDMKNTYSLIAVDPAKIDGLNTEGAQAFIDWMLGDEASALIAKYGEEQYGVALFTLIEN